MTDDPSPPKPWILAALLAPALLALLAWALDASRLWPSTRENLLLALAAAAALVPLALLPVILARISPTRPEEIDARVLKALEAVARAEGIAQQAIATVARAGPATTRGSRARSAAGRAIVLLALLTGLGGAVAYGFTLIPDDRIPEPHFHIHASLHIYVDGQRVNYTDPAFDLASRGHLISHLHVPDDATLHIEGVRGQTLAKILDRAIATRLANDALTLDDLKHDGATHRNEGDQRLRFFLASGWTDDWIEMSQAASYVPRDGDRILITYGNPTEAQITDWQKGVPLPPKSG